VEGTVINSLTGAPVPRANVTLTGHGDEQPAERYGTTSGADGSFAITGVKADTYWAEAERAGFAAADANGGRVRVAVLDGDQKTGVEIRLAPTGAIIGRVTDANSDPIEGALVAAEGGAGWATTDEKGRYRIGGLSPYKYRVEANSRPGFYDGPPEIRSDGTAEVHLAPTYYPGALAKKEAVLVQVRPGAETSGIDIQLLAVPFVRISGRIVGKPSGIPASLLVREGTGTSQIPAHAGDSFELWRLTPGKYTISAQWFKTDGGLVQTSSAEIEIAGSNIDNIELSVVPDSTIPGQLEFDNDEAQQTFPKDGAKVSLAGGSDEDPEASIDLHGNFQLDKVPPGKYRVDLSWDNAYIKSMRLGTTPIEGSMLDLNNGSGGAELTILVATASGSISGKVEAATKAPEGTTVVLTAAEPGTGFEGRTADVRDDGTYSLNSLPPGNYKIIAVTEDEVDFDDNSAIGFEDQMETVEVRDKEKVTKDLAARTRPDQ
jgi:hypothetical protein